MMVTLADTSPPPPGEDPTIIILLCLAVVLSAVGIAALSVEVFG